MVKVHRFLGNPILSPRANNAWENEAAFNGCPIADGNTYHLLYRAMGKPQNINGKQVELSVVGHAESRDRITFANRTILIAPQHEWEMYGCEDPRVTKIEDTYYIFYTALSTFPPSPSGIAVAVALSKDLVSIQERHPVTPFNAKAMALFPEKINGKFTAILTAHTDLPPSKICIVTFEKESDIWDPAFWNDWHKRMDEFALPLLHSSHDHVEVGAPPVKTEHGWILLFCYISNYLSSNKLFGIEAVLLDSLDPRKILGRTTHPLLTPEHEYELYGKIPNVIFPSGALVFNDTLGIYYGAADTTCCVATVNISALIKDMKSNAK